MATKPVNIITYPSRRLSPHVLKSNPSLRSTKVLWSILVSSIIIGTAGIYGLTWSLNQTEEAWSTEYLDLLIVRLSFLGLNIYALLGGLGAAAALLRQRSSQAPHKRYFYLEKAARMERLFTMAALIALTLMVTILFTWLFTPGAGIERIQQIIFFNVVVWLGIALYALWSLWRLEGAQEADKYGRDQ